MKKAIFTAGFVAASLLSANAALTINWNGTGGLTFLYQENGTPLAGSGYLIQLVIDADNKTSVGTMISSRQLGVGSETALGGVSGNGLAEADDDIVSASWVGSWNPASSGAFYAPFQGDDVTPNNSDRFYFRWFNAGSQEAATEAGFIYNSANAWVAPADDTASAASADIQYAGTEPNAVGSTYTAGPNDGWATVAPVPEPTTMALMGLGLAAVAARRRFAKKA
jgi:hypothetical protein